MSGNRKRLGRENLERMRQAVGMLKEASEILTGIENSEDVQSKWLFPHHLANSRKALDEIKWDLTREYLL